MVWVVDIWCLVDSIALERCWLCQSSVEWGLARSLNLNVWDHIFLRLLNHLPEGILVRFVCMLYSLTLETSVMIVKAWLHNAQITALTLSLQALMPVAHFAFWLWAVYIFWGHLSLCDLSHRFLWLVFLILMTAFGFLLIRGGALLFVWVIEQVKEIMKAKLAARHLSSCGRLVATELCIRIMNRLILQKIRIEWKSLLKDDKERERSSWVALVSKMRCGTALSIILYRGFVIHKGSQFLLLWLGLWLVRFLSFWVFPLASPAQL